ncbi:helix-turn-helix domain-containing protein [Aeromonas veronii]|uniref:helix-turn-helix domain-containing protein n=1 Tax=Aeromonas veronii TaxID=654 RepID=UPI001D086D73
MTPFGIYLENLRRSRRIQQKQLADLMGINPCYVSTLERGRKGPPSAEVLNRLIKNLNLLHIPADHEHRFRFNVNTISGPM